MKKNSPKTENLKVFARIRPLLPQESNQSISLHKKTEQTLSLKYRDNLVSMVLDKVFGSDEPQSEVYQALDQSINNCIFQGINCGILAYGQTGSGKTYTMFGGNNTQPNELTDNDSGKGLIPRLMENVLNSCPENGEIMISFLQIYNETLDDLLAEDSAYALEIQEHKHAGIYIKGLTEFRVNNIRDALYLIKRGEKSRAIRQTQMNSNSSRSHLILIAKYQSKENEDGTIYVLNQLF